MAPNGRITAAHVEKIVRKMQRQKLNENCQKSPVTNPPPLPKFKEGEKVKVKPTDSHDAW